MTRRIRCSALAPLSLWIIAAAVAPQAFGSGFQLREQSPAAQGTSFAGVTAGGPDIGSMFFNPAAMTRFDGKEAIIGFSLVQPTAKLEGGTGSRAAIFPAPVRPISGTGTDPNAAESAMLPNLYAMWSVSPDLKLGLSINAPFGMATNYDASFVGRYHALKSDLSVVDIAPNIAYRINPQWSIGAALIARKAEAELTNAVDFGSISAALAPGSALPGSADGTATLKGSKWGYGYRLGVLFEPTETLHLGFAHHGAMSMTLKGDTTYSGVPAGLSTFFRNGEVTAEMKLPSMTSLGIEWEASPTLTVHGEIARTGWSDFKELRVKFSTGQSDSVTEENWKDTWFYALGLTWKATEAWTLRTGIAMDQGAMDNAYRTPRIPDGDRTWISIGAGYTVSQKLSFDAAYTHISVKDGPLELKAITDPAHPTDTNRNPNLFRGDLSGTYKNSIEIFSLQARFRF